MIISNCCSVNIYMIAQLVVWVGEGNPEFESYSGHSTNLTTDWTFRGSNPGRGKIFFSCPKCLPKLWYSSSFLFSGYRRSLPEIKRAEREADHFPLYAFLVWTGTTLPLPLPLPSTCFLNSSFVVYLRTVPNLTYWQASLGRPWGSRYKTGNVRVT